ncbi:MAG TPA: DUF4395 domain-containing protein, partial [Actinomycetota bacterium]|nr:DUF4395 domain-containing protein [Actinomycetota bacterium]
MIDSHLPRFSQALQALILAVAFLLQVDIVVPLLGVIMGVAALGGPRWNVFAYVYKGLPIPRGEPEAAAPPRFAQSLGTVFLGIATVGLYTLRAESTAWWV